MSQEKGPAVTVQLLSRALHRIRSTPPRIIASPPTQPRRAAVALIIRVVPSPSFSRVQLPPTPPTLSEFFALDWVNDTQASPEILFLRRDSPAPESDPSLVNSRLHNTREAHVAFPGGRMEEGDEGGLYTAMRQTWEELGLDLAESHFTSIGQLDDREITTSLGKRLLMILSPFVFLQLTPAPPPTDPTPTTTLHWTPLASLVSASVSVPVPQNGHADGKEYGSQVAPKSSGPRWSSVSVDAASRLAPRHSTALRLLVQCLVGSMQFPAILLDPLSLYPTAEKDSGALHASSKSPPLKLWGLTLGMTLDLMSYMVPPNSSSSRLRPSSSLSTTMQLQPHPLATALQLHLPFTGTSAGVDMDVIAPSLASVFPRFSYPDVNFWIWVFGKRYRQVVRGWEASVRAGGTNDRRINWAGTALNTFYASVRKALVVVIVLRALGVLVGFALVGWWFLV